MRVLLRARRRQLAARARTQPSVSSVESLESRQLLSAAYMDGGTLVLVGNPSAPNALAVNLWNRDTQILAGGKNAGITVARSAVKAIRITGGELNDSVWVSPDLVVPTYIDGRGGHDTIGGGGGNDTIVGGTGNDSIRGWNGLDSITGNEGNDYLSGGEGDDSISGGNDNDTLSGENGNDRLDGGSGNDRLIGHTGNDLLWGSDGDDILEGWSGNDTLFGGAGDDTLEGGSDDDALDGEAGVNRLIGGFGKNTTTNTGGHSSFDSPDVPVDPSLSLGAWTTLNASSSDRLAPAVSVKLLGKIITAGGAVHVNATETKFSAGTALTARFDWNFGDTAAPYNKLTGWTAAHQYDAPGDYTVSLTVTDEAGRQTRLTTTVKVNADARRTFYVSSLGNDANTGLSPDKPIRTWARAAQLVNDQTRILFRRGDRFDASDQLHITQNNVLIGAYGTGAKPVIRKVNGPTHVMISTWKTSTDIVIRDLTFDSIYTPVGNTAGWINATAVNPGGSNIVVRNNTFLNINYAVNAERHPGGLLVQGNDCPDPTGLRSYLVWGQGTDHTYIGNLVANSTREHGIRTSDLHRALIAFNDISNLNRETIDGPDYSKATINFQRGSWGYLASNKLTEGAFQVGPRGLVSEGPNVRTETVVVEGNLVHGDSLQLMPGARSVMVRNNIFTQYQNDNNIVVRATDSLGRYVKDVWFLNNTGYNSATDGRFLNVGGVAYGLTVMNNLFVMPNMAIGASRTSSVAVQTNDLSAFTKIANNVWQLPKSITRWAQGGYNYVGSGWVSSGYRTAQEWDAFPQVSGDRFLNTTIDPTTFAPAGWTVAATSGVGVPGVSLDYFGKPRPSGVSGASIGAVQG